MAAQPDQVKGKAMKIKNSKSACWMLGLSAVVLASGSLARAQDATTDTTTTDTTTTTTTETTAMPDRGTAPDSGAMSGNMGESSTAPDGKNMDGMGSMGAMDSRSKNAAMLIQTLSEEKTEINALAAQQARFKQMGGRENLHLATMWGRWIREHKAGGPMFMKLIKQNGGDPMAAKVLKAPVLGTREQMLDATHKDHMAAVMSSQMRRGMTGSPAVMRAMHKRANLARKHLHQMAPYHMKHDMMKMDKMSVQG